MTLAIGTTGAISHNDPALRGSASRKWKSAQNAYSRDAGVYSSVHGQSRGAGPARRDRPAMRYQFLIKDSPMTRPRSDTLQLYPEGLRAEEVGPYSNDACTPIRFITVS